MKNKIEDLRNHLFDQLERLMDVDGDLEKEQERAMHVIEVAKTIIDTARVENEFLQITGVKGNTFIPTSEDKKLLG